MPIKNDNLQADLNQIQADQQTILQHIREIKQDADDATLPHLEQIENDASKIISEINKINQIKTVAPASRSFSSYSRNSEKDKIERNSILSRMPTPVSNPNRRKIGNIWV